MTLDKLPKDTIKDGGNKNPSKSIGNPGRHRCPINKQIARNPPTSNWSQRQTPSKKWDNPWWKPCRTDPSVRINNRLLFDVLAGEIQSLPIQSSLHLSSSSFFKFLPLQHGQSNPCFRRGSVVSPQPDRLTVGAPDARDAVRTGLTGWLPISPTG